MNPPESLLRRMMAEAGGESYHPLASLSAAQSDPQGIVIFEGDDGGQIYLVCPARHITCSEETLQKLLVDFDTIEWPENDDPSMRRVYFESRAAGKSVPGGVGGGQVMDSPWIHPRLVEKGLLERILDVLCGKRDRIM
jgi:hypothetical protein